ncbi:hypothetical protein GCM10027347_26700 [Larkinella harenae]
MRKYVFGILTLIIPSAVFSQSFTLVSPTAQASLVVSEKEPECVQLAVQDLVTDVQKITGKTLTVSHKLTDCSNCVLIGSQSVAESQKWLHRLLPGADTLRGKWENYRVLSSGNWLFLTGSDERGTMFAIYDFLEKQLGVDPFYFWTDREPAKQPTLRWEAVSIQQHTPTFRYRGWFINDEDLLTEWVNSGAARNIDYPYYKQVVDPSVMRHVVEALVRSRCNLIIPASFLDIRQPAEAALVKEAARRGVFVSMHHIEPMGVSAFTFFNYWNERGKKPLFSFYSSRKELEEVWRVYAQEWAKYPNVIWQIGLRGIGDRPMWMADPGIPQTDADRGRLISEAMQTQMNMIRAVDKRKSIPITTTLWAEGSVLNAKGFLKIPDGVVQVFADNSPGWKWQADFRDTQRQPNTTYGIYYHHQLWSAGPHLAQGVPPAQTHTVIREAVQKGFTEYGIMNVSNIREFVLGTAATANMWYNFPSFDPDHFLTDWCQHHFGSAAPAAERAYRSYFDSFAMHDGRKVPFLLDGQSRSFGNALLNQLKKQITQPADYAADLRKTAKPTAESEWGQTSLGDAHPKEPDTTRFLEKIRLQHYSFLKAGEQIQQTAATMSADQQAFLQTNLLVSQQFMAALTGWLEALVLAKQAENKGNRAETIYYLKQASQQLSGVDAAKKLLPANEKWQHWYRGDRKMNLDTVKKLTAEVLALAETTTKP